MLNGIFSILHTAAQGRELPERYGTCEVRPRPVQPLERLHLKLDEQGRIEPGPLVH